ncbi:2Fe-2S iron-sulfur cluster-binding protein [Streptomyces sp. NPDC058470]|uniref:2Fe-2S iron-sulfur cluster-binding protein n=1 Tax=Streptomyces sp. NPDC058470 TaxID=3346515 RepID=UPI003648814F
MTDDQYAEDAPQGGRWDPLPQGDYDDGATAFVKLPEGGIEALIAEREPLAARGHGYVPPQIEVPPPAPAATDPAQGGAWAAPADAVQWPDPNGAPAGAGPDGYGYNPGVTGQWDFGDVARDGAGPGRIDHSGQAGHPGSAGPSASDVTGQWSIPVATGDIPDESGEFTTSALVEQWGGTPPATLPGGASAPWATESTGQTTEAIGQAWSAEPRERAAEDAVRPSAQTPAESLAGPSAQSPAGSAAQDAQQAAEPAHEAPEAPDADRAREESEAADAAEAAADTETPLTAPHDEHPLASYVLRVNGADRPVTDAWIGESLLYVLRERLGLAGAKDGCSQGECGACNVQVDGRLVASCLVPAVTAASSEVRTVEGLAADGQPSDVQRALAKCGAVQCGFCVPGMAMTVHDLLEGNPAPNELETRQALCGNLCRCSGYRGVLDAVREVVAEREAHSAATAESAPDADEARIPRQAGPGGGGVNASVYGDTSSYNPPYDPQAPHEQPYGQDGGQA